ncbi:MAG: hypothetical protein HYV63_22440, partial [Candidatus Schekmanbacteria bacterium]|nr:hypothetical protein [Candidatus Schekmanbacteria bacterium]
EPDPALRDYESVPLKEDVAAYMAREVLPHVPDAWVDESKTKVGYEIGLNRYIYTYTAPARGDRGGAEADRAGDRRHAGGGDGVMARNGRPPEAGHGH